MSDIKITCKAGNVVATFSGAGDQERARWAALTATEAFAFRMGTPATATLCDEGGIDHGNVSDIKICTDVGTVGVDQVLGWIEEAILIPPTERGTVALAKDAHATITALVAEIARLTAELAASRAVTPDVEASRPATVGGLLATACEGEIVEFVSPDGMYHQAVVAGGRLLSRRWQHALSHSPGDWTLYAFWLDGAYLRQPARLVPADQADLDPNQRGPLPKGG